jgi:ATP-binding protein involved in chromosome partitioning
VKTYHDIAGDGGSDVLGQVAARQRAVADALAGVRRILAVGSGKGGVGKSTVTLALARAFRRRGLRVAILDADLNGPSQARMAGLESAPWIPADGQLALPRRPDGIGVVSLGSLLAAGRPLAFDTVSRGEQQTWRATRELALLLQLLSSVRWGELDLLLVDLPPGAERTVQYAELLAPLSRGGPAQAAEEAAAAERLAFVMVTVPSDVSRGVVARALAALAETPAALLGYVENMAGYLCRDCGEVRPLFPQPTVALDAPCLGRIPFDPALAELCDRGWPEGSAVEEDSEAFRQIEELAAEIQDRLKRPSSVSAGVGGGPNQEPLEEETR